MRVFIAAFLLLSVFAVSQGYGQSRGSIPEELLRPKKGEAPRYPVDIVIGSLGRGSASVAAYSYANSVVTGFMSGLTGHPSLASINPVVRESSLAALTAVDPVSFRIGSGRMEADGAVSYLVRFIGKERAITGELYIRYVSGRGEAADGEETAAGSWAFDELLLEEPRDREMEFREALNRIDFYPYERFY